MSGNTLNRVFELQCMVARLQTLASLECMVLSSSPYISWWPCAIQPTVYAVANLLGIWLWLLGNRKQTYLSQQQVNFQLCQPPTCIVWLHIWNNNKLLTWNATFTDNLLSGLREDRKVGGLGNLPNSGPSWTHHSNSSVQIQMAEKRKGSVHRIHLCSTVLVWKWVGLQSVEHLDQ